MKKIISLMLILISLFAFVSCGCQETPDDPPEDDPVEVDPENMLPLIPIAPQ